MSNKDCEKLEWLVNEGLCMDESHRYEKGVAPEMPTQKQLVKMSVDEIAKLIEQARDAIGEE